MTAIGSCRTASATRRSAGLNDGSAARIRSLMPIAPGMVDGAVGASISEGFFITEGKLRMPRERGGAARLTTDVGFMTGRLLEFSSTAQRAVRRQPLAEIGDLRRAVRGPE
ncbi:hypothetical protein GCM10025780_01120 [Frondihabitans cladoniiphilus]|uniref:Uncharacterized protein n=1 Tax=Frondihabitans cladoniiphilus TaxID=715785 RepID=A0ABP8VKN7_9MICO